MKIFVFVLTLKTLSLHYCNGFTHSGLKTPSQHTVGVISRPPTATKIDNVNEKEESANKKPISIALTAALAWTFGTSTSLALPPINLTATSSGSSSSFVIAAEYSNSDFTDFSLPSYQETLSAELNTNLKGGKQLFGDGASSASSTSPSDAATTSTPAASQKKELTAADLKAEKAAAKAAQKAAREAQQAAAEAALGAK